MPIRIIRDDITKVQCDAIVNAANKTLLGGGGVDGAIHKAAGIGLFFDCLKLRGCKVGEAKITPAHKLPCKYVIHTVGPKWKDGNHNEEEQLASCYTNSLLLAKENNCESVAFPLISTGVYKFPKAKALQIAVDTISSFLEDNDIDVTIVVYEKSDFQIDESLNDRLSQFIIDKHEGYLLGLKYSKWPSITAEIELPKGFAFKLGRYRPSLEDLTSVKCQIERPHRKKKKFSRRTARGRRWTGKPRHWDIRNINECADTEDTLSAARLLERIEELEREELKRKGITIDAEYDEILSPSEDKKRGWQCDADSWVDDQSFDEHLPHGHFVHEGSGAVRHHRLDLEEKLLQKDESFTQALFRMIDERGWTDPQCYKKANVDRKLFSKMRCEENYHPKKTTAIAFAIALELSYEETQEFIGKAGYTLTRSSELDLIVEFFIEEKNYNVMAINSALFDRDQKLLG